MTREAEDAVIGALDEMVGELKAMRVVLHTILGMLGGAASSSVEIASSARGHDIKAKAYPNSPITEAGQAAMDEYLRVRAELEQRLMDGMAKEATRRAG